MSIRVSAFTVEVGDTQQLEINRGEDRRYELSFTSSSAALDMTGVQACVLTVRSRTTGILIFARSYSGFIGAASLGTPYFDIIQTDTESIAEGPYDVDVSWIDASNYKTVLLELSTFLVLKQAGQSTDSVTVPPSVPIAFGLNWLSGMWSSPTGGYNINDALQAYDGSLGATAISTFRAIAQGATSYPITNALDVDPDWAYVGQHGGGGAGGSSSVGATSLQNLYSNGGPSGGIIRVASGIGGFIIRDSFPAIGGARTLFGVQSASGASGTVYVDIPNQGIVRFKSPQSAGSASGAFMFDTTANVANNGYPLLGVANQGVVYGGLVAVGPAIGGPLMAFAAVRGIPVVLNGDSAQLSDNNSNSIYVGTGIGAQFRDSAGDTLSLIDGRLTLFPTGASGAVAAMNLEYLPTAATGSIWTLGVPSLISNALDQLSLRAGGSTMVTATGLVSPALNWTGPLQLGTTGATSMFIGNTLMGVTGIFMNPGASGYVWLPTGALGIQAPHTISNGGTPQATVGTRFTPLVGNSISIVGTDEVGKITLTTGTGSIATAPELSVFTITYSRPFPRGSALNVLPDDVATSLAFFGQSISVCYGIWNATTTTATFITHTSTGVNTSTTYTFNYTVKGY